MYSKFRGTGVALVTPFNKDGSINFKNFEKVINRCIDGKVDYLVPLGTTGESVTLNREEKNTVLNFVVETVKKRVPVVLGLGGNNTDEIVHQLSYMDLSQVDAILSVSPYYNKPSQAGLYQHYKTIAAACPLPLILYNVPARTGSNMLAETTLQLAENINNIIGIKEASGNLEQVMKIIQNKPKDFLVISGDDAITLPIIACGGDGVISVVANAYPRDFSDLVRYALEGNFEKARKLHYKLLDFIQTLFADGNPGGIKAALSIMNVCEDHVRLPLVGVNKTTLNKLTSLIESEARQGIAVVS